MPSFFLSPGGNPEAWAKDLRLEDFELLCLDGTRKPVTEAQSCHLAMAPNHAVVSRGEKATHLKKVLLEQQVWIAGGPPPSPNGTGCCAAARVHLSRPSA